MTASDPLERRRQAGAWCDQFEENNRRWLKSTIAAWEGDEPRLSYEEIDTSLIPPRPRLYGLVGAPECGDVMKLQIKVNPTTGVIEDAKFKTFGCGSAIASSSLATEWLKGKTVEEAHAIKNTAIVEELALPPVKVHCSVLAEDAIKAALKNYQDKQGAGEQKAESAAQPVPAGV